MKKLTTLVLLAFFVLTGMSAQTTAKEQAQTLAERFFKQGQRVQSGTKGVRNVAATSLECRWDSRDVLPASSAAPTFYAFEPEVGQGFVIVAGDGDNARVIGYSYENSLPEAANMPDGLADFLGGVDAQVMAVRGGAASVSVKAATPVGNVVVNLNTAPWGQRAPFNNLCFTSTGASAATGCVPTAYSILMFHHKWPVAAKSTTVYHPGTGEAHQIGYEYDWDNMISNYSGTYSEAQAAAVATLMRDFGYANGVAYGTSETGGNESATTLVNYFKYKSETPRNTGAAEAYVTGRDIVADDTKWKQYIKESLDAGCPIPYSSTTTGGGRHVFICDGYTDADYYHFNWGWSGSGNGWFTLDNMTPDATSDYSNSHKAYFMLKPNRPTHVVSVEPSSYLMGTATINGSSVAVVEEGQKATLVATPNSTDYVFVKWTKGEELVSRSATTTVTITGADTYTAHFGEAAATADVEIAVAVSTGGTATINGKDAVTIAVGEPITLVATPASGYYFVNWTKGAEVVSTSATYETTAQGYCTYTANFAAVKTVRVRALGSGAYRYVGLTGTANSVDIAVGSTAVVRTEPLDGETTKFAYWTKGKSYANGGQIVSNKNPYEFVVTEAIDLYINYVDAATDLNVPVEVVSANVSEGTVTLNGSTSTQNLPLGSEITLSATPEVGYRFANWTKNVVSQSSLSMRSSGEVVSTEPIYTTILTEGVSYTANFERLAADPSTPPVVELPEVTNGFIKGDGVLRFYRLALPITLSSFQNDFGSNATQVYAFWQEAETFLNKVYIPLGICFEVVEDARLIASSRNDIDNNPINAASYGTELTNGLIGKDAYDVGMWIAPPADEDNSGVSALSGAYSKVAKGSGYAKADVTVVGHELGHLFGAQHVHDDYVHTEPGFGSSIMGYGDQLPFFSVASLRAIRSEMVSKNHSFYADAARTQLVGSDGGNNYVYGVVPGTSSAPMISATGMKASYSIPKGACFAMPIPATDANSDRLTYAFQQYEDGAMFRAYAPQENNVVDFRPSYVLWADDDNYFTAEDGSNIPSMAAGTYNFAAVVNDLPAASNMTLAAMQSNPFYSNYDAFQTQVTIVNGESFTVSLSPNKASYAAGEKVTVSWGVNSDYFGTKLVRILLSDDYGKTFKYTLAENVAATNGSCQVTMPDLNLTTEREQFGNYKTNVRPGIIRVEVVNDIAYSLSWTNPASATAEGGFLVTGGSGEGGGDEGEGEQTEDITAEKAALSNLLAEMKAYIATFATVEKYVMGGYTDYQVTFTADHGAVTADMVAEAYRAMDAAEATRETATTKAELNTSIAALQTKLTDLQTNKALPGEGGEGGEGEDLTADKAALQAVIDQTEALLETCAKVTVTETEQTVKLPLQTGDANADGHLYCNAPYVVDKNSTDYSPASEGYWLLDGDDKTFLHTNWDTKNNTADDDLDHYIRVYSAEALDKFTFTYTTRWNQTGDIWVGNPTVIEVEGSNEANGTYNTIATLSSGLPIQQKKTKAQVYTSDLLNPPTPYKYIRFRVTATEQNNSAHGHKWFYISEFAFSKVETVKVYEAVLHGSNGVTEAIAIDTYKAIEEATAALSATTADELTAAKAALQAQYEVLLAASNSNVDKAALRTIIDQTQALVDACYDVKDGNKVFKYGGSLYITEADAQEAAAAVEAAEATYNLGTLTQTQCDAEVTKMQGVYDKLYYAVSHATLPVMVTTDWTNPYIYTIGINRSATSLLEWDENTSMVAVAGKYELGNEAQAWCFTDATDGRVYIAPYDDKIVGKTVSIAEGEGSFTASNSNNTWHSAWTGNTGLVLSCKGNSGAVKNNMQFGDGALCLHSGDDRPCVWTLTAPDGYVIDSYSFNYKMRTATDPAETFVVNSTDYVCSSEVQTMKVTNVNSSSTFFKQKGNNKGVALTDFKVVLRPTSSSYRVLSSNALSEGDSKVIDVVKGTDGFTQEWTIVYNADKNMYNIYCLNDKGDKYYFSNHGGDGKKMGFYNKVNDDGSLFRFSTLDAKSLSYSDAYNNLYNFVHNDITIHHTLEGHNTAVGYYTEDMANAYNAAYEAANTALDAVADDATCEACYTALFDANSALEINMPLPGRYYRFRSASTKDYCKDALMYADPETHSLRWSKEKRDDDATTYWCFYMGGSAGNYAIENLHTGTSTPQNGFGSFASMVGAGAQISITSLSTEGKVGIYSKGTMMHAQETDQVIVNWSGDENSASAWYIEEANIYDVVYSINISKYGYAGMHLNYSVKVPDEVDAYAVTNATGESGTATLTKIENGIVPANTGVILTSSMAKEDPNGKTYELEYTTSGASVSSWLKGSNYKTLLKADANMDYYLFGVKSGVVALYKAYKELTLDGKNCRDLTDDEITAVTSTLPQAGYVYYLCNKHMKGDVYFSDNGNAIGFNKSSDAAYKYKWECIVENGQYMFRNLETGKYFGWQGLSNNAYAWELYDTVQKDYGEGLQAGCVSMKNGDFLVVENASEWDKSSKDGYYNNQFSSSFYFVPVGKMTTKTNEGGYFKCSANKIYLPYSTAANAAKFSFRFDEGTTTDLEEALFGNEEGQEIYDLQGRRIERITAPGLYIVNGQKRYVKAVKF